MKRRQRWPRSVLMALLLALLAVPRLVALDADTWPVLALRNDTGIWTDEGFYTYNARNAVLFGKAEMDEFNNRNLSPVLDAAQRAVFRTFGVGLVQARAISVVCGLLALGFFFDAMRRVWGLRIGITALLLLGAEVTFILYNRLALMETPSTLVLCAALWALTLSSPAGWALAGALAAGAVAFKTTFLVFLPLPVLAWLWRSSETKRLVRRPAYWYVAGAALGAGLYLALWGIPRGPEIWRMNNYYRTRQVQPRSVKQAGDLVHRATMGYKRGILQFLETRTPVLTTLALVGLLAVPVARGRREAGAAALPSDRAARRRDVGRVLWLWAGLSFAALALSRYSPSRYYLIAYPALAGLAALALWRLVPLWRWARAHRESWWALPLLLGLWAVPDLIAEVLWASTSSPALFWGAYTLLVASGALALWRLLPRRRLLWERRSALRPAALFGIPAFFLSYHLLLPAVYVLPPVQPYVGRAAQVLAALLTAGILYGLLRRPRRAAAPRPLALAMLAVFLMVSLGQWAAWYATRGYRTRDVARELAGVVGPHEVLLGDWAPNLCLDNTRRAVPVLIHLANWEDPVRRFDAAYVLVTQTPVPVRFWRRTAPEVVAPGNIVRRIEIHDHHLYLYRVPPESRAGAVARGAEPRRPDAPPEGAL